MRVAILGASPKPDRYSHKAQALLKEYGHEVLPVNPQHSLIDGDRVFPSLNDVPPPVDVVTVYVGPSHAGSFASSLLALRPPCVIFNPGAENPTLQESLEALGVRCVEACTLVLLRTGTFTQTVMEGE